jgi:hypothetical protein
MQTVVQWLCSLVPLVAAAALDRCLFPLEPLQPVLLALLPSVSARVTAVLVAAPHSRPVLVQVLLAQAVRLCCRLAALALVSAAQLS